MFRVHEAALMLSVLACNYFFPQSYTQDKQPIVNNILYNERLPDRGRLEKNGEMKAFLCEE